MFSVFSDSKVPIFMLFFSNLILKYASVEVKAGFLNELWLQEIIFKVIMIYSNTGIGHAMTENQKKSERARQDICLTRNARNTKYKKTNVCWTAAVK